MLQRMTFLLFFVLMAASTLVAQPPVGTLTRERIFLKPYIAGTRPTGASISPDGKLIFFQWDEKAENKNKQWIINADGTNAHVLKDTTIDDFAIAPDGKAVACLKNGDIFLTDTSFSSFTRLTKTNDHENGLTWSQDGKWLAYQSDGKLMATQPRGNLLIEFAEGNGKEKSVQFIAMSKDNKRALIIERTRPDTTKEYLVPKYTGKEVTTRPVKVGNGSMRVGFAPFDTGKIVWVKLPGSDKGFSGACELSPDGRMALIERYSLDRKSREIFVADADSGKAVRVLHETDAAWVENDGYDAHWMPDSKHLVYTSEKEGWAHLYMVTPDGKNTERLTKGDWEIDWFTVDPSGDKVYIQANKEEHAQWQIYAVDVATHSLTRLTTRVGMYDNPTMAKDGSFIVCNYSNLGVPTELVCVNTRVMPPVDQIQLTHSVPAEFNTIAWTIPDVVQFKARDGKMIPAFVYKPSQFDSTKKYPVVVFVHGAGYLQNVNRSWSYYYREYMFHTRLNQLGYVVFEVEYRGSAGLGRDFRADVYMHLGGKDLTDEVDGIDWLNAQGYIDPARVGIYGGSYGGFMALMGMFCTDRYACGATLRGVTSWENYYDHNPWYTEARLGKPAEHAEAYKISSPITYADSLKKPLLILHGMVDDNVFFQDAVQLINKLQKSKKKFELMMYPDEAHSFTQPESWFDEYSRIEEFFNKNLHPDNTR